MEDGNETHNQQEQRLIEILASAEKILAELEQKKSNAETLAASAKASMETCESASTSAKTELESIQATSTTAQQKSAEFAASLKSLQTKANEDSATLATLAENAATMKAEITEYKQNIDKIIDENTKSFEELKVKIEGLLPGATSAGLASAFDDRKRIIVSSQSTWKWVFFGSLIASFIAGIWLLSVYLPVNGNQDVAFDWTQFMRGIIPRLVLMTPLFWLAGFSARQLSVRFRLEEDYAHKEALSRAFEGYKREMTSMKEADGVAANLANVVIAALAEAPVRLYDANIKSDSPIDKIKEVVTSKSVEK